MKTQKIILTAIFASIGIVLPQALHMIGGPTLGPIFLPIHLPVFIGAMLLGPRSGVIIALVSLFIGFTMGMPPYPIIVFMAFEMIVYALASGYLYYILKINVLFSLVIAKTLGMITALITINIALLLTDVSLPPIYGALGMFTVSIPGIIIQLLLIPILVVRLKGVYQNNERLS